MNNKAIKSHEDILLGNSLETILSYNDYIPRISEYQFQRDVLFLLKNPFDKQNLMRYQPYVQELTRPLNVVANDDHSKVLFQIPALMMSPKTTIAKGNGMTAENFFQSLRREYELGGKLVNEKIAFFMQKITVVPDVQEHVINPLRQILNQYGQDFDVPGLINPTAAQGASSINVNRGSSFENEYED